MRSLPKRAAPLWDGLVELDADVSYILAGLVARGGCQLVLIMQILDISASKTCLWLPGLIF
jgi:hypothetical protein